MEVFGRNPRAAKRRPVVCVAAVRNAKMSGRDCAGGGVYYSYSYYHCPPPPPLLPGSKACKTSGECARSAKSSVENSLNAAAA